MKTNEIKNAKAQHEKIYQKKIFNIRSRNVHIYTVTQYWHFSDDILKIISLRSLGNIVQQWRVQRPCPHSVLSLNSDARCSLCYSVRRVTCSAAVNVKKANVFDAGHVQKWALFLLCSSIHLAGFMSNFSMLSNQESCCAPLMNSSMLMLPAERKQSREHHVEERLGSVYRTQVAFLRVLGFCVILSYFRKKLAFYFLNKESRLHFMCEWWMSLETGQSLDTLSF